MISSRPATSSSTTSPSGSPFDDLIDGGAMDCGSGLLLLITRAIRRLPPGGLLGVRSSEPSVRVDLPVWANLTGHSIHAEHADSPSGPWLFVVRKAAAASVFSVGDSTPLGTRLWAYTNFDCNLTCQYCCAQSSPKADARRLSLDTATQAFTEFKALGGREVFFTGGEPFMHPELGSLISAAQGFSRTVLTNAMVFGRGARRSTLESLERDVALQVSLDSATPDLHDAQRGTGSWSRAMAGIGLARSLGFRVRVAATLYSEDVEAVAALNARLEAEGVDPEDRVIRPVAHEGSADQGVHVSIDSLAPEPTITADGAWWHPVAVTNPNMRIAEAPLPLSEVFGVIADTLAVHDAAAATGRQVFRCA